MIIEDTGLGIERTAQLVVVQDDAQAPHEETEGGLLPPPLRRAGARLRHSPFRRDGDDGGERRRGLVVRARPRPISDWGTLTPLACLPSPLASS
jgi:hypothetical protein